MRKIGTYGPALLFLVGSVLVARSGIQRAMPLRGPIDSVLPSVDGYTARNLRVSDEERRVAGMTNYVARAFSRDTTVAFTTLVSYYDHQSRGKSIHSPKNCLPGAGWEVLSSGTQPVSVNGATYVVNRYLLKNGPTAAVVYYWYQGRGRVVASEYAVKWNLLHDAALKGHTEEALVRVVVPLGTAMPGADARSNASLAQASSLGTAISQRLISDVEKVLPHESAGS